MTYKIMITPVLGKKYIHPFFSATTEESAMINKQIFLRKGYDGSSGTYVAISNATVIKFD